MLILHAVQKLLNTSKIETGQYITKPAEGQLLHSWYAGLFSSTFPGKLMVMYVHEPSMLTVVCRGKTVKATWPQFEQRLPVLLQRYHFSQAFIEAEMKEAGGYVVAKTNNRSMLGRMNQMHHQLEHDCSRFETYEAISPDVLEDRMMDMLYSTGRRNYTSPIRYWQQANFIK
jgi:hypothetical protein